MPRNARKKSVSGIYHVMLRGINRQVIFEDNEDRSKFIQVLKESKAKSKFALYAYCLMGNHVHLLMKEQEEPLEKIFKRIGASYVYYYNLKYKRTGHLFQDRFRSEPVESDEYFLTVLRYIHQNPVKARLSDITSKYRWSSYNDYIGNTGITDISFGLSLFGDHRSETVISIKQFLEEQNVDQCLELQDDGVRLNDKEAQKIIVKLLRIKDSSGFQKMNADKRDRSIAILKEHGLSIRQISRLTGLSFGIVRK